MIRLASESKHPDGGDSDEHSDGKDGECGLTNIAKDVQITAKSKKGKTNLKLQCAEAGKSATYPTLICEKDGKVYPDKKAAKKGEGEIEKDKRIECGLYPLPDLLPKPFPIREKAIPNPIPRPNNFV